MKWSQRGQTIKSPFPPAFYAMQFMCSFY